MVQIVRNRRRAHAVLLHAGVAGLVAAGFCGVMMLSAVAQERVPLPPKPPASADATKADAAGEQSVAQVTGAVPRPPRRPKGYAPETVTRVKDFETLRTAINALGRNDFSNALAHAAKLTTPVSRSLFNWAFVRDSSLAAGHARISAFVRDHPNWPQAELIQGRLEASLYADRANPTAVLGSLTALDPWTGAGKTALALAYKAAGNGPAALQWARAAWRDHGLSRSQEDAVYTAFGDKLTAADHRARLHLLLFDNDFDDALRVAARLGSDSVKLVEARKAVTDRSGKAGALLDALPASVRDTPVAQLSRVQVLRRDDKSDKAAAILAKAPQDAESLVDVGQWWLERKILSRRMLDAGDTATAYELAARHGAISGLAFAEAEFMAGWIALRYLNDPARALPHFQTLAGGVETDLSLSRGLYWTARAHEAAGNIEAAREVYRKAGDYFATYYGQLARIKLGGEASVDMPPLPEPTPEQRAAFNAHPLVQAARLLHDMNEPGMARIFLLQLAQQFTDKVNIALAGRLSEEFGMSNVTVRIGKVAASMVPGIAFPTSAIPDYTQRGADVEPALVHAIARQESEFRHDVVSPAGARGLMQLMPATARATAKSIGLAYKSASLTADPAYNVTIGSAHLGELIEQFDGSYIMTIAAYNAGPRRVYQWIEAFGDPRKPGVDPIDWIERIPFSETRNYVQRVLENLQMYRAALNGGSHPIHLAGDLTRGR